MAFESASALNGIEWNGWSREIECSDRALGCQAQPFAQAEEGLLDGEECLTLPAWRTRMRCAAWPELISGLRVNEQGSLEPIDDARPLERLDDLTAEVAVQRPEPGSPGAVLKWLFAPAGERTISPISASYWKNTCGG